MTLPSFLELLKAISAGLALMSDTTKIKRAIAKANANWHRRPTQWHQIVIDLVIVSISFGGPIHYAFQVSHDIATMT